MDKHLVIICSFVCSILLFPLLWGCDKQAESPPKSKEVTKKIIITKEKGASKPQTPEKIDTAKLNSKKEPVKLKPEVVANISKAKTDVSNKKLTASVSTITPKKVKPKINDFYNPKGKLDPFAPLFKKETAALIVKKKKTKRRTPLTPLEKVALSQLKLVGIILAPSENRALVQEASGKGYVVKKGTYIGNRSGKIVQILQDRIIVEEEVEDISGNISVLKKQLQLQKPPGE